MSKFIFKKVVTFILLVLFFSNLVKAEVIITEIMFDPEGTDTGREWLEIKNIGPDSFDLINYKIFEGGVNHKLALYSGVNSVINSDEYVVVADNAEKFMIDFPSFSGKLFDSVFSLVNTGEEIKIVNSSGTEQDVVTYDPNLGGQNSGNSLQFGDFGWIPAGPTPGLENATEAQDEGDEEDDSTNTATSSEINTTISSHENLAEVSNYTPVKRLVTSAGRNRVSTINTPIIFEATHNYNFGNKPKFKWNMGDGEVRTGSRIKHLYQAEGSYNVVLNGRVGDSIAVSRTKIDVLKPYVEILCISSGKDVDIMLKNKLKNEVNFGRFYVTFGEKTFLIPSDTIISGGKSLLLSSKTTGFTYPQSVEGEYVKGADSTNVARFFYPNGDLLTRCNQADITDLNFDILKK